LERRIATLIETAQLKAFIHPRPEHATNQVGFDRAKAAYDPIGFAKQLYALATVDALYSEMKSQGNPIGGGNAIFFEHANSEMLQKLRQVEGSDGNVLSTSLFERIEKAIGTEDFSEKPDWQTAADVMMYSGGARKSLKQTGWTPPSITVDGTEIDHELLSTAKAPQELLSFASHLDKVARHGWTAVVALYSKEYVSPCFA
jgi:hypothetical protein